MPRRCPTLPSRPVFFQSQQSRSNLAHKMPSVAGQRAAIQVRFVATPSVLCGVRRRLRAAGVVAHRRPGRGRRRDGKSRPGQCEGHGEVPHAAPDQPDSAAHTPLPRHRPLLIPSPTSLPHTPPCPTDRQGGGQGYGFRPHLRRRMASIWPGSPAARRHQLLCQEVRRLIGLR